MLYTTIQDIAQILEQHHQEHLSDLNFVQALEFLKENGLLTEEKSQQPAAFRNYRKNSHSLWPGCFCFYPPSLSE